MSALKESLLLAYYGDDFTGSTDALEFLSRAGLKTMLFLEPPSPEQLQHFSGLQAIGVAGLSRSLAPAPMTQELERAFHALRALRPEHVHYKVCSTFDSSPTIGSIGRAIEVGAQVFEQAWVPLLVAAPALGRYCVFGNLFARMGIGSAGQIHRLDRHPAMSRHPITPADESDLRRHLARQTNKPIGLVDILTVDQPLTDAGKALAEAVRNGAEIVLFDALYPAQLPLIGALLDGERQARGITTFSVGSSGVDMALGAHWADTGRLTPVQLWPDPGGKTPLLVVSGSCSPVTAAQIDWAQSHGFATHAFPTDIGNVDTLLKEVTASLQMGRHTVVHTSRGETAATPIPARVLGTRLGQFALAVMKRHPVSRLLLAGGDTSSYAGRALGIEAVEMVAPLAPGAPLCRAHGKDPAVHGCEVNFKGGQVGSADYFGSVARGRMETST